MDNCIFCKIANKEIASNIIYEDDMAVAFPDLDPKAPSHILVIPKQHISSLSEVTTEHERLLGHLLWVVSFIAQQQKIDQSGFRTIINTGADAGQEVFHIHLHLLGGGPLGKMVQPQG